MASPMMTTMPFGKYKGQKFEDLPEDYVDWLLYKSDFELRDGLREELEKEERHREGPRPGQQASRSKTSPSGPGPWPTKVPGDLHAAVVAIIEAGTLHITSPKAEEAKEWLYKALAI